VQHARPGEAHATHDPPVTAPQSGAAALLARALVRGRWWVLAFWAGVGVVAVPRAARVPDRLDVRGGSLEPTEASRVDALLATRFRQDVGETFLLIVSGPGPFDSGPGYALLDALGATLGHEPYVRAVSSFAAGRDSALLSADRRSALVLVTLSVARPDSVLQLVFPLRAAARRALVALAGGAAYRVIVTGDTPLERDMLTVTTEDVGRSERRLLPAAGVILLVACGSLVAALVPLALGFLAIAVALAAIGALATVWPMSIYVLNVATMIGLGVGIDYSLLVLTRFREEVERGATTGEAVARTVTTAGVTVAASGLSVAVGFAGLLFTPLVETRSIGIGGLVVVAVAVLLATTFLPAVLLLFGPRVARRWWRAGRFSAAALWGRWAELLARRPGWALVAGSLVLAGLTAPVTRLRAGLPVRHWWPSGTEAGEGLDLLQRIGGVGYVQPVRVVVDWPSGRSAVEPGALRALRVLSDSLRADPRVRAVQSLVDLRAKASLLEYALLYSDLAAVRARDPAALDRFLSTDRRATRLDVVLADTTSLLGAMDVVRHARRVAAARLKPLTEARVSVGGYVAANVDFQDDLLHRLPLLGGVILAATALMLGLVFRSVLIPVKAVLVNALSVGATLGLIVLVFQEGPGGTGAIFVAVPVLVFAVVFGLSMDYEVFLLARIKEAFDRSGDTERATVEGLTVTAGVISSAALLMIAVFGAFAFARVLVIQLLGFGLAVAVLLDATVIRLVLVPAVLHLAGRWNWWPGTRVGSLGRPAPGTGGAAR
jgi:RND superfamily putative drug exporter